MIKHLWKLEQMELSDSNLKYLFIRLWINAEALPFFWCGLNHHAKQFEAYYFTAYVVHLSFPLTKRMRMTAGIHVLTELLCHYNVD